MIKEYVSSPAKLKEDVKQMVLSGEVNPLLVKVMYDIFSEAMNDPDVKNEIMKEADLHEKEFEINGFRFMKASRTTYSFKHDAEWQRLEGMRKAREELMKTAVGQEIVDGNTGEVVPPAYKSSSEYIRKIR